MIYFSLGLPGHVARWCDAAIEQLVLRRHGGTVARQEFPAAGRLPESLVSTTAADEAAVTLIRQDAGNLVICVHQPDIALKDILADATTRFVLALNDPRATAQELGVPHDLTEATRVIANACPFTLDCMTLPGVHTVSLEDLADGGQRAIRAIAYHLDLGVEDSAMVEIAQGLTHLLPGAPWDQDMPAAERQMLDGVLKGYAACFAGGTLGDLIWPARLFTLGSDPSRAPDMPIPLREVGNGLFILYGPYLALPPGYWSAKVHLGVSPEAAGQIFTLDIYGGHRLAMEKFSPRTAGLFTVELTFATDRFTGQHIEMRVTISRNSAPGELTFDHVSLHPIALRNPTSPIQRQGDYRAGLLL